MVSPFVDSLLSGPSLFLWKRQIHSRESKQRKKVGGNAYPGYENGLGPKPATLNVGKLNGDNLGGSAHCYLQTKRRKGNSARDRDTKFQHRFLVRGKMRRILARRGGKKISRTRKERRKISKFERVERAEGGKEGGAFSFAGEKRKGGSVRAKRSVKSKFKSMVSFGKKKEFGRKAWGKGVKGPILKRNLAKNRRTV